MFSFNEGLARILKEKIYILINRIANIKNKKYINLADFFLEDLFNKTNNSGSIISDKIILLGIMHEYYRHYFKIRNLGDLEKQIEKKYLKDNEKTLYEINCSVEMIKSFFIYFLKDPFYKKNLNLGFNLSLKYFSFISKEYNNPIFAYKELICTLKKYKSNNSDITYLLFRYKAKFLSKETQEKLLTLVRMSRKEKINRSVGKGEISMASFLLFQNFVPFDFFKRETIKDIIEASNDKILFWEKMIDEFSTMDQYMNFSQELSKKLIKIRNNFQNRLNELSKHKDLQKDHVLIFKMKSMIHSIVLNDIPTAFKFEARALDIMKKSNENLLTSKDIVDNKAVVIFASITDVGNIVKPIYNSSAKFFGYSNEDEFEMVEHIHNLMPKRFAQLHQHFLLRAVNKGDTSVFDYSRNVICMRKDNFIFSTYVYFKVFYGFKDEFLASAVFKEILQHQWLLIGNEKGSIDGISKIMNPEIYMYFSKEDLEIIYKSFSILHFFPNLFDEVPKPEKIHPGRKTIFSNKKFLCYCPRDVVFFIAKFMEDIDCAENVMSTIFSQSSKSNSLAFGIAENRDYNTFDVHIRENREKIKNFMDDCFNLEYIDRYVAKLDLIEVSYYNFTYKLESFYHIKVIEINKDYNDETFINSLNKNENSNHVLYEETQVKQTVFRGIKKLESESLDAFKEKPKSFKMNDSPHSYQENIFYNPNDYKIIPAIMPIKDKEVFETVNEDPSRIISEFSIDSSGGMDNSIKKEDAKNISENKNSSKIKGKKLVYNQKNEAKFSSGICEKDKFSSETGNIKKSKAQNNQSLGSMESAHNSTAGLTSVKDIIYSNERPKILNKILYSMYFQIFVFVLINIVYITLIQSNLSVFKETIEKIGYPSKLFSGISITMAANFPAFLSSQNLYPQSKVLEIFNQSKYLQHFALNDTKNYYMTTIYGSYGEKFLQKSSITMISDYKNEIVEMEIGKFIKYSINYFDELLEGFKINNYKFFEANLEKTFEIVRLLRDYYLNVGNNQKENLNNFLIMLSCIGLSIGICLNFIIIPLIISYVSIIEKFLMIGGRIPEMEAYKEIEILREIIELFKGKDESYLKKNFAKTLKRKSEETDIKTKNNAKIFLIRKIGNQYISKGQYFKNIFVIVTVFIIYFGIILVLTSEISSTLNTTIKMIFTTDEIKNSIFALSAGEKTLISSKYFSGDIINFNKNLEYFNRQKKILEESSLHLLSLSDNVFKNDLEFFDKFMKGNLCEFFIEISCNKKQYEVFKHGLQGSIPYYIFLANKVLEFLKNSPQGINSTKIIYSDEFVTNDFYINYNMALYVNKFIDKIVINSKKIVEDATWLLLLIYILGGTLSSILIILLSFLFCFKLSQELKNIKLILLMIPLKRLADETTIHLLKKTQNAL